MQLKIFFCDWGALKHGVRQVATLGSVLFVHLLHPNAFMVLTAVTLPVCLPVLCSVFCIIDDYFTSHCSFDWNWIHGLHNNVCVYVCRNLGPIEVTKWKELMAADLKRADDALSKGMITNIVKLFLEQSSMEEIPLELRPQFMRCATFIVTNEVMILCLF